LEELRKEIKENKRGKNSLDKQQTGIVEVSSE